MLNIVLFGPPGCGKGTQSQNIIDKYGLIHLSTGDLFREHLSNGTALGKMAQEYMDKGKLVPDKVVIGMVEDKIAHHLEDKGFIFDGFPRTVHQAEALDRMLAKHGLEISGMIALEAPEKELIKRILNRGKTSGRTDDQDEGKIATRIHEYENKTTPVADYYQSQNKFNGINGVGSIQGIFKAISTAIDTF